MATQTACPAPEALRQFLRNEIAAGMALPIERHLAACELCASHLEKLLAADELVEAMQHAEQVEANFPRSEVLRSLQQRLSGMRPTFVSGAASSPGRNEPGEGRPTTTPILPLDYTPFLGAPEEADELGRVGPYRLLRLLGRGGMGMVFQAEDTLRKRPVAFKMVLPAYVGDSSLRSHFLRAAQAMASFTHDRLVRVHQVGEAEGLPFFVMDYLEGKSLKNWLAEQAKRSIRQILRLTREIAEGLASAHEQGIVHRDLQPGNIWLEGEQHRVKLLDVGLARPLTQEMRLANPGAMLGNPAYMAPELVDGQEVDARADLFSLGCVLHELCCNQLPFPGNTTLQILARMVRTVPKPLHERNPKVPPALSRLGAKLLEKDRHQRPISAREVVDAIGAIEQQLAQRKAGRERREGNHDS